MTTERFRHPLPTRRVGVLLALAILPLLPPRAGAAPMTLAAFGELALRCAPNVAPSTLASIGETETRLDPLMINDNTTAVSGAPATPEIAAQVATRLLASGHSVDLGLMQINGANLVPLHMAVADAFDPCRSLAAAAAILTGDFSGGTTTAAQQAALRVALSRYNTGDAQRGFDNGYVHKVELAAQQVNRTVPALDVSALPPPPAGAGTAAVSTGELPPPPAPVSMPNWNVWDADTADGAAAAAVGLVDASASAPSGDPPPTAVLSDVTAATPAPINP